MSAQCGAEGCGCVFGRGLGRRSVSWCCRAELWRRRARVSLTLRLICGYLLRSLLPFLTFLYLAPRLSRGTSSQPRCAFWLLGSQAAGGQQAGGLGRYRSWRTCSARQCSKFRRGRKSCSRYALSHSICFPKHTGDGTSFSFKHTSGCGPQLCRAAILGIKGRGEAGGH